MCAITGIVGQSKQHSDPLITRMLALMHHRGPDESGQYVEDGIALGHNRLSIIDPESQGLYPMTSACGRYILTYNGEIFNYCEIKQKIGKRYPFKSDTDAEVLLAAFVLWGKECLQELRGMFAFAIWDRQDRELFAARDHFGIKPFYFCQQSGYFSFASEIKPLLLTMQETSPNTEVIQQYLNLGLYDHGNETFFDHVNKLDAGCYLTFKNNQLTQTRYWDLHKIEQRHWDLTELRKELEATIAETINISIRSDVPLGINMSGGFDSSLLSNLIVDAEEFNEGMLHCFSQDYDDPRFSEKENIQLNLSQLPCRVSYSYLEPNDFVQGFDALQWHQEEPYAGVPVAGYIGIYQSASAKGITVLLDGNGLDEAAGGYKSYHQAYLQELFNTQHENFPKFREQFISEWQLDETQIKRLDATLRKHSQTSNQSLGMATDGSQVSHADLLHDAFSNVKDPNLTPVTNTKSMMIRDIMETKIPRALRFNDRISMAFSKELRVPYLDKKLFELFFSIPNHLLFDQNRPKGLLRSTFKNRGHIKVSQTPKQSIQTPQTEWFKNELFDYLCDSVNDSSFDTLGYYNTSAVKRHLEDIKQGRQEIKNSFYLWQMINISQWYGQFIQSKVDQRPPIFPKIQVVDTNLTKSSSAKAASF